MDLLNSLPGYRIRGENNGALLPMFRAVEQLKIARYKWGNGETTPQHPWYGAYLIDPHQFALGCVETFFASVLRPEPGTRACGFKEIRYTSAQLKDEEFPAFLDFMNRHFPGAAFIFNLRNVEDTLKSGWWANQNPENARAVISNAIERMQKYHRTARNTFLFDHDKFREDPAHFAELCCFLGEDHNPDTTRDVRQRTHDVHS